MYGNRKILALIPARGGSKGIPHKNIIDLNGKPLIAYTIDSAKKSRYIDNIVVSTDDQNIADVSKKLGAKVPFIRPTYLAADESKTEDVVLHALQYLENNGESYDVLILLQPTQPLRTEDDIDKALELFEKLDEQSVVSISEVSDNPILIRRLGEGGQLEKLLKRSSTCRRQDMEAYYRVNGAIYINRINEISENTSLNDNCIGFLMDRSHSIDIDTYEDLDWARFYLNKRGGLI